MITGPGLDRAKPKGEKVEIEGEAGEEGGEGAGGEVETSHHHLTSGVAGPLQGVEAGGSTVPGVSEDRTPIPLDLGASTPTPLAGARGTTLEAGARAKPTPPPP